MIIYYLHFMRVLVLPAKAQSVAVVDAEAVLSSSVPFKRLDPIAWW